MGFLFSKNVRTSFVFLIQAIKNYLQKNIQSLVEVRYSIVALFSYVTKSYSVCITVITLVLLQAWTITNNNETVFRTA